MLLNDSQLSKRAMGHPKILVVDDEEDFQDLVRQILEPAGFAVISAADGVEALAAMRRDSPDLMILDVNMPLKDGYAVCREVRADPRFAELPILMMTIRRLDSEIVKGLAEGADDYLAKPFDPWVLKARIKRLLERR